MTSTGPIYYAYGIIRAGSDVTGAPPGIGGGRVDTVDIGELRALVSALDADEYAPALIEERTGDVEWLAPHAEAHDAVVSWAGEPGPVVPLHMWSLFRDRGSVGEMLARRAEELHEVLKRLEGADEYGLRVYGDAAAVALAAGAVDDSIRELERSAQDAGPGQRYLLERKLDGARRSAARALAQSTADNVFATLAAKSVAAVRDEIPNRETADAGAVLSAAFLVRRAELDAFRGAVTALVRELEPQGFRFSFTGPWAPYHFAEGGA